MPNSDSIKTGLAIFGALTILSLAIMGLIYLGESMHKNPIVTVGK